MIVDYPKPPPVCLPKPRYSSDTLFPGRLCFLSPPSLNRPLRQTRPRLHKQRFPFQLFPGSAGIPAGEIGVIATCRQGCRRSRVFILCAATAQFARQARRSLTTGGRRKTKSVLPIPVCLKGASCCANYFSCRLFAYFEYFAVINLRAPLPFLRCIRSF